MTYVALHFCGKNPVELWQSYFSHHLLEKPKVCIRGKSTGAFLNSNGSFQWTPAVIALSLLFLKHKIAGLYDPEGYGMMIGHRGSLASSLNSSIEKAPNWLAEMFGTCHSGNLIFKKLVKRSNVGQKLIGPIAVSLNPKIIPACSIDILLNNKEVTSAEKLGMLAKQIVRALPKERALELNAFWGTFDQEHCSTDQGQLFLFQKEA